MTKTQLGLLKLTANVLTEFCDIYDVKTEDVDNLTYHLNEVNRAIINQGRSSRKLK